MAKYYKTKTLKPLTVGENVLFKLVDNGPRVEGQIIQIGKYPRSHIVEGKISGSYRRTRRQETYNNFCFEKVDKDELDSQSKCNLTTDAKCAHFGKK